MTYRRRHLLKEKFYFEDRGNSGKKIYSAVSLTAAQLGRIDSRRLEENRRAVSRGTNTALLPFAMPQLLEVYQYVKGNLPFVMVRASLKAPWLTENLLKQ